MSLSPQPLPQSVLIRSVRHGRQVVKTAVDERAGRRLEREARWLRELESVQELEGQVPRLLDEGTDGDGRRYLVMSALPDEGRQASSGAFTPSHARFLASLGKARFRATDFEVSGCCQWLQRGLRQIESGATAKARATLEQAYHDCETALLYWTGPYVLSQGDFAPWNIRDLGSQLFVFEWGNARTEASPLDDVLHYLMVQQALRSRALSASVLQAAMRRAGDFAREAYPEWSWRPQVIGALSLVYLLGVVLGRSLASGRLDRADPVTGAYWKLVEKRSAWMPA
ncbi:MAG: Phosphotransferase enzyme family [Betaproteobacteria bacterium]|nr:Phosphotransferase enzyme family [Betaproteobacteria bacterium]